MANHVLHEDQGHIQLLNLTKATYNNVKRIIVCFDIFTDIKHMHTNGIIITNCLITTHHGAEQLISCFYLSTVNQPFKNHII
uniref:Uncharacterized protein n=1 Tax=Arundo donax TaxID=35708 RepID=A0A0A9EEZ4_ARUDO